MDEEEEFALAPRSGDELNDDGLAPKESSEAPNKPSTGCVSIGDAGGSSTCSRGASESKERAERGETVLYSIVLGRGCRLT